MAGYTGVFDKEASAVLLECLPFCRAAGGFQPFLEFILWEHSHLAQHFRVSFAAKFGTVQLEFSGMNRFKPGDRVTVRQNVHFDAEIGDKETMNYVLRRHQKFYGLVY